MDISEKLKILADAAKYDASCSSSGVERSSRGGSIGNSSAAGICHSFSADGRCISLLKVLLSNSCIYNCSYCVNRACNDTPRASFSPRELAELTINFYRRNYIEGLFLSSGILRDPDYTCEQMIETLRILRQEYRFMGYIHAKAIPGADERLLNRLGHLADRVSVNIEFPSQKSLLKLAPDKTKASITRPMALLRDGIRENRSDMVLYKSAVPFVPAGQSTQMIIGATPETDYQILNLSAALYKKYAMKRVFYSAYIPLAEDPRLPAVTSKPPLLREHRLYQADWLLRFYGFDPSELLDERHPTLNPLIDPKCNWAINHMELFPVEINTADKEMLLRVPGIGVKSVIKILKARRYRRLDFDDLKQLGISVKRARFFITCRGKSAAGVRMEPDIILSSLITAQGNQLLDLQYEQLSLFSDTRFLPREEVISCVSGQI